MCVYVSVAQGMVEAADYISNKIREENLLTSAFQSDPVIIFASDYVTTNIDG